MPFEVAKQGEDLWFALHASLFYIVNKNCNGTKWF